MKHTLSIAPLLVALLPQLLGAVPRSTAGPATGPQAERAGAVSLERVVVSTTVAVHGPDGRFIPGLDRSRFEVFDDGARQQVEFFSDADMPVTLGIIFDLSSSMSGRLDRARDALSRMLEHRNADDEYFLVTFGDRPRLAQTFTSDPEAVTRALRGANARGNTALYDALLTGAEVARGGRHERRALLVISDGRDTDSRYRYDEVRERLAEADVLLYAVGVLDHASADPRTSAGWMLLDRLTRVAGGRGFACASESELTESCVEVALELRQLYSIAFYQSDEDDDGRWHKLRVRVRAPDGSRRFAVRAKAGHRSARPDGRTP